MPGWRDVRLAFAISAYEGHLLVASVRLPWPAHASVPAPQPPARVFLGDAGSLLVGFSSPRWV
jgi:hypothetical protein